MARRIDYVSPEAGKIKDEGGTTFVIHYGKNNVHRERYAGDEPAGMHATPALLATRAHLRRFLRRLRPLSDEADQIAMAKTCIEKGWTEAELQEAIEKLEAKRAEKGKGPARGKGKTAPRSPGFDDVELKAMKINDARRVLTYIDGRVRAMRAQDSDAEKVARQVGVMEGLKMAYGLKDPPKAAFTQKDEDGSDAGDDE
jgi:hypothetical protein